MSPPISTAGSTGSSTEGHAAMASNSTIVACLGRSAPIAASGRDHARGDRIRARLADRVRRALTRAAPNAPGQLASHYAPKAELRLGAVDASADEAVLDFGGSLERRRRERAARSFAVRRPHRGRVASIFLSCAPWTPRGVARIAVAPIPEPWAWRGDQRSAPPRGGAPRKLNNGRHHSAQIRRRPGKWLEEDGWRCDLASRQTRRRR